MSRENTEWGDRYEKPITVNGETYIEVGVRDPGNEGYHTIRVPFDEEAGSESVEEEVSNAKKKLTSHVEDIE